MLARLDAIDVVFQMAVRGEQIEPAVEVVVPEEQAELRAPAASSGPRPVEIASSMNCISLAVGDVQGGHLVGEVADGDAQRLVVAEPRGVDAHRPAGVAVHVEGDARTRRSPETCRRR